MTKKNWIILAISALILAILIPAVSHWARHGLGSGVTLSHPESTDTPAPSSSEPEAQPSATVVATPTPQGLSVEDRRKLSILNEIFASKNDNDPRMDSDLVNLSPELKKTMTEKYQHLVPEKRNERGTLVFLIGRELKDHADVDFLKSVLMEKPCLSLSDCSKPVSMPSEEELHLAGMNETTANYPQLMAIRQMEKAYQKWAQAGVAHPLSGEVVQALREALHSPNPRVADEARRALDTIGIN